MKKHLYSLLLILIPLVVSGQAVLTAVFDADLPGGLPKCVELYITQDITDLSMLGIGSANNGSGSNGVEFAFPAMPIDSGNYLYISNDSLMFNGFFGFDPDFISGAMAINGDDAIELFWDSLVIDIFGDINVDGTGQPWEYVDGWAARNPLTGPDGSAFVLQNWTFSGINALDTETTNASAQNPVPIRSYTDTTSTGPDVIVILQNLVFVPRDVTIEIGQTVRWTNVEMNEDHNVNGLITEYPCNPTGFFSGLSKVGPWDYDVKFNISGFYDYQCDPHVSFGMVGTVTVIDPDAPDYPPYEISQVHSEDGSGNADSAGIICEIRGVAHGPNFRPSGLQFTLIDVAHSIGINVFKGGADCYEVTEGDLIVVQGTIAQFNGLTAIIPAEKIEVISSGNALMTPVDVNNSLDESLESAMVRVASISVDSIIETGGTGWDLFGTNPGATQYFVRLDNDVFSDASLYDGATIHVTGIVGQYDSDSPYLDGYQLNPRSTQDIEFVSSTSTLPQSLIKLRPNPASEYMYLYSDLKIEKIRIFSSTGQLIYDAVYNGSELNISKFASGAYLIFAETPEGRWSSKFFKN